MPPLQQFLEEKYPRPEFQGRRHGGRGRVPVDDRQRSDRTSDFCEIYVRDLENDRYELQLYGLPLSKRLRELLDKHNGRLAERHGRGDVTLTLGLRDTPMIRELATDTLRVIGRSRERDYDDPNLAWICRRTSESLKRLATAVVAYKRESSATRTR